MRLASGMRHLPTRKKQQSQLNGPPEYATLQAEQQYNPKTGSKVSRSVLISPKNTRKDEPVRDHSKQRNSSRNEASPHVPSLSAEPLSLGNLRSDPRLAKKNTLLSRAINNQSHVLPVRYGNDNKGVFTWSSETQILAGSVNINSSSSNIRGQQRLSSLSPTTEQLYSQETSKERRRKQKKLTALQRISMEQIDLIESQKSRPPGTKSMLDRLPKVV